MPRRPAMLERFRVEPNRRFRLAHVDPEDSCGIEKKQGQARLAARAARLGELQECLFAEGRWAVLIVLQGMDAAGKDGVIEHVLSQVNPAGCQVTAFKAPSTEELSHDFLWRASRALPARGRLGIFNRSYYEEVVTVRVHPEFLAKQDLPPRLVSESIWEQRFEDIVAFERMLSRNGVLIRKFFLHISREEQKRRFLARLDEPEKNWKFQLGDVKERAHWAEYQRYWSEALRATSTRLAPWFVVPSDKKWFTRLFVAEAAVAAFEELDLRFPRLDAARRAQLDAARVQLEAEPES